MCPSCGFSGAEQEAQLGAAAIVMERVHDPADWFGADGTELVDQALGEFAADFPQLFLAVHCGPLPPLAGIRSFAFWLLNHAAVSGVDITQPNENGALLVLDPAIGQASLVVGYFLESLVSEETLERCLATGQKHWRLGHMAAGALATVAAFHREMRGVAARIGKRPEKPDAAPDLRKGLEAPSTNEEPPHSSSAREEES